MRPLESLFVVALVLYSTAIWSHKFTGALKAWMVAVFGAGLAADVAGTVFLCVVAAQRWVWNLHTVAGLAALVIMGLHFGWAVLASRAPGPWARYFDRWSVRAWLLWLVAFVSGIPR